MKQFFTFLGIVAMGATAYGQADTDIVNIPDENFKRFLVEFLSIDTNRDKEISYGEARAYKGSFMIQNDDIKNFEGIEALVNITELHLYNDNDQLTSLDVSKNKALRRLTCSCRKLTSLDVSKNTALQELSCNNTQLTSLDVSKNTALTYLDCSNTQLTSLDVSKNTALTYLDCSGSQLTNLDVSKNTALTYLDCSYNQLTNLDVSKNTALKELNCSNNQLTSLDVSKNTALKTLWCYSNQLTQLNLANGNNNNLYSRTQNNPNLMCIQIDKGAYTMWWQRDDHASYSTNCNYPSLSTTEVKAENAIQILNPVKDNLVIKTTAKIESIEIYNTAGQLVKVLFKGNTQVQDLAKGIYLVKITTDKGVITQKIIKQ